MVPPKAQEQENGWQCIWLQTACLRKLIFPTKLKLLSADLWACRIPVHWYSKMVQRWIKGYDRINYVCSSMHAHFTIHYLLHHIIVIIAATSQHVVLVKMVRDSDTLSGHEFISEFCVWKKLDYQKIIILCAKPYFDKN